MTKISKHEGEKTVKETYFREAQSLYLAGKSLAEIQELTHVPMETLKTWVGAGRWEEKKIQAQISPRWMAEALMGRLREKTVLILAKGDFKPTDVEELTKLSLLIERLRGQSWDIRAAALEVMDRFYEFLQGWVKDKEEINRFSAWLDQFFQKLEDDQETEG